MKEKKSLIGIGLYVLTMIGFIAGGFVLIDLLPKVGTAVFAEINAAPVLFSTMAKYCLVVGLIVAISLLVTRKRLSTNWRPSVWLFVSIGYLAICEYGSNLSFIIATVGGWYVFLLNNFIKERKYLLSLSEVEHQSLRREVLQ
ncbi:MAG: hypothetical protein NUV82_01060 [Candidatus Komeilibacteria bacterium]|nr:hypothetical protein [Candidatus Komeilibacteria bacterium]